MNLNTKIRLLQTFNHIVTFPAIGYAVYTEQYWLFAVAAISWLIVGPISTVVTLHRMLTHRSFKTYPLLEKIMIYTTVFSTVGPTINWVALHRLHHATCDTIGDPHSPYINGKFSIIQSIKVWLGYDWKIPNIPISYVKDLLREPIHRFIFNNYFKIIFVYSLILLFIDPILWLFVYVVPASMTVHIIGLVNVLGHTQGYRNYETADYSTNSWIANLVSLGDGWHNNHHAHPTKWYTGVNPREWDLMGRLIQFIKK